MSDHIASIKGYLLIFASLLALTGITIAIAFVDLGVMNTVMALAIAGVKASLVVLYFMHLKHGTALAKSFWTAGLLWLAILLVFTMNDYLTRGWLPQPAGWTGAPSANIRVTE